MDWKRMIIPTLLIILIVYFASLSFLSKEKYADELLDCQSELLRQEIASRDSKAQYRNCEEALFNCKHGVK
jgi:hypothetical protein